MHLFKTPAEAMAFLSGQREEKRVSYQHICSKMRMDTERVKRLLDGRMTGQREMDNSFMVQCFADILGFNMTIRISCKGYVLTDSTANRDIGQAFRTLRGLKGIDIGRACSLLRTTKQALGHFEEGRTDAAGSYFEDGGTQSEGSYFSHDKLCRWAKDLDAEMVIVLRPKAQAARRAA